MALEYGYFDSEITGYDEEGMPIFDRAKTSDFMADFFAHLITSGVLAYPSECFQVLAHDGLTVKVNPGYAFVKGRFVYDKDPAYLTLEDAPKVSAYKRIDMIVLRNNYPERKSEILVKTGTPSNSPKAPELIQAENNDFFELCLATIYINSNQTVISQAAITDTRFNNAYCGAVTQLIDHLDTKVFFTQLDGFYADFTASCNRFYAESTKDLSNYLTNFKADGDAYIEALKQSCDDAFAKVKKESSEQYAALKEYLDGIQQAGDVYLSDLQTSCNTYLRDIQEAGNAYLTEIRNSGKSYLEDFSKKCGAYLGEIKETSDSYLDEIETSGNARLDAIIDEMQRMKQQDGAEFQDWFDSVKGALSGDEAGSLLLLIQELQKQQPAYYIGTITHSLEGYPHCDLYYYTTGFGCIGFGEGEFGGDNAVTTVPARFELAPGSVKVIVPFEFKGTPEIVKKSNTEFLFMFPENIKNLLLVMR